MNILTSNAHFRQRVIKKSYKVGVTEAQDIIASAEMPYMNGEINMMGAGKALLIKATGRTIIRTSIHLQKKK